MICIRLSLGRGFTKNGRPIYAFTGFYILWQQTTAIFLQLNDWIFTDTILLQPYHEFQSVKVLYFIYVSTLASIFLPWNLYGLCLHKDFHLYFHSTYSVRPTGSIIPRL